ncbi:MAG: glycogen debranching enzyme family protein [Cyanobacteria bacterium SZAS LIN-2]|nr:glycogen debranching enzyme family protein [Cyanobacteria bacterium SZAS LIN-2]
MTFGLIGWLKSQHPEIDYEIPVWYPGKDQPDNREWLVTNGLGGFSMGTVSGANTRRYHSYLTAALTPPVSRRVILSRVEELITIDGVAYELASNYWASGVVSPTGFKRLDCFTTLPTPTWVFDVGGHYLIKRLCLAQGTNQLLLGYTFLADPDAQVNDVKLTTRFLVGFRDTNSTVKGASNDSYPQFVSANQSLVILNETGNRLCLTWNNGQYEPQKQWWWDFNWPEESARGEADGEDLFLVGSLTSALTAEKEVSVGASFEDIISGPDCHGAVNEIIKRQNKLIRRASLPRSGKTDALILACDQFFVPDAFDKKERKARRQDDANERLSIMTGYPWFNDSGRAALYSLPGLALTTRRFDDARAVLRTFAGRLRDGIVANRTIDPLSPFVAFVEPGLEYSSADVSLWYGHALYSYYRVTRDKELVVELLPVLLQTFQSYAAATVSGIAVDARDGLLRTGLADTELTWMDSTVEDIPITPRAGKAIEINALWYSFLETILYLAEEAGVALNNKDQVKKLADQARASLQKFWHADLNCLYDVIDRESFSRELGARSNGNDASLRPNQLIAVSMPFRAFTATQEKAILATVESALLTPVGVRTLAPDDSQYQGYYGCGFQHADRYHRDLSYHQGTAWTWLTGAYVEALVNVYGSTPETASRVKLLLQPLTAHLLEEGCLGSMSEIFDGSRPHLARGCPAQAAAVAAAMRWVGWQVRQ